MRILDLFCGAGGASAGYWRAGFEVIGVDIEPQPEYPVQFIKADALEVLADREFVAGFDAIHASPPCQAYTSLQAGTNAKAGRHYPRLTEPVRELLDMTGKPYIIENPAARRDIRLCGLMFGLGVFRHRWFELGNWTMPAPAEPSHEGHRVRGWRHGQFHDGDMVAAYGDGGGKASVAEMQAAMDMPWVGTRHGLTEAIPPAFTECIGRALLAHLSRLAVSA